MKNCDYCKKEANYILDFRGEESVTKISSCEKHLKIASYKQDSIKMCEEFKQRSKIFQRKWINL